jgi:hypothetical protein
MGQISGAQPSPQSGLRPENNLRIVA